MKILYDIFEVPPPPETVEPRGYGKRKRTATKYFKYRTETEEI